MPKNSPDLSPGKEDQGPSPPSPASVALCRYQELAEAENRFREQQDREQTACDQPVLPTLSHLAPPEKKLGQGREETGGSVEHAFEKEIDRHLCEGDDGSQVTVVEYQHHIELKANGRQRSYPCVRRLALTNGDAVRRVDEDTFEVIDTGELISKAKKRGTATMRDPSLYSISVAAGP